MVTAFTNDGIYLVTSLSVLLGDNPVRHPVRVLLGDCGDPSLRGLIEKFDGFDAVVGEVPERAVAPPFTWVSSLSRAIYREE